MSRRAVLGTAGCTLCLQMLEARNLIVRSKLMLPDGKGNSGWTTTQLIHLPRYAPRLAIGSEAIIRVSLG